MRILTDIFKIGFDVEDEVHVKIVKAVYYKVFVEHEENAGRIYR